jgi:hypothetical protein
LSTEELLDSTLIPAAGLAFFVLFLGVWSARRYAFYPAV